MLVIMLMVSGFLQSVVIKGGKCPQLLGEMDIKAVVFRGGKLSLIPFQVDKVKDGKFLPRSGPLEEDDEMVFIAQDAGEKVRRMDIPARKAVEVEIDVKGERKYVYLVAGLRGDFDFKGYMSAGDNWVESPFYRLEFYPKTANIKSAWVKLNDWIKIGDGVSGKLFMDVFGIFKMRKTDEDISWKVKFTKVGAVRVIKAISLRIKLIAGIPIPAAEAYAIYYPQYMVVPFIINVPFRVSRVAKSAYGELVTKLSMEVMGSRYRANNIDKPIEVVPGVEIEGIGGHRWGYFEKGNIKFAYFLREIDKLPDVPEIILKVYPGGVTAGYRINIINLESGTYKIELLGISVFGDFKDVLHALETPYEFKIR